MAVVDLIGLFMAGADLNVALSEMNQTLDSTRYSVDNTIFAGVFFILNYTLRKYIPTLSNQAYNLGPPLTLQQNACLIATGRE